MAVTKKDIYNYALSALHEQTLTVLGGSDSKREDALDTFFQAAYEKSLQDATWSFATVVADLTVTSEEPDDWAFEYELPSNLLRIIDIPLTGIINSRDNWPTTRNAIRAQYALRVRAGTQYLYCDLQDASLRYIYDPGNDTDDDYALWTQPFALYCGAVLAEMAAYDIKGKEDSGRLGRLKQQRFDEAVMLDLTTQRSESPFNSRYTNGRY